MALTLKDAMRYTGGMRDADVLAEMGRPTFLVGDLSPLPPRTRWQRFAGAIEHLLRYRLVVRHLDAPCDCEDW